ncbi:hypothetical protein [Paenibacillus beijingensis]|nr:hypothetical protein [Paenibacillus beijingensis]
MEKASRALLQPERREAMLLAELDNEMEAECDWFVGTMVPRREQAEG